MHRYGTYKVLYHSKLHRTTESSRRTPPFSAMDSTLSHRRTRHQLNTELSVGLTVSSETGKPVTIALHEGTLEGRGI
jgi:hypothetical protein